MDGKLHRARAALLEAALQPDRWSDALSALADACGARSGQLIVRNEDGAIPVHLLSGMPEGFIAEIEAFGLADPSRNPRAELGLAAAEMVAVLDQDHVSADARKRLPIYGEMFEPHDIPYNCQAVLKRHGGALVRASVTRTHMQGAFDDASIQAFNALTPALQAVVRLHLAFNTEKLAATLAAFELSATAAIIVDLQARIMAATKAGQALIESGDLPVKNDRLHLSTRAVASGFSARLNQALACSRAGVTGDAPPLTMRRSTGGVLQVECHALPCERDQFGLGPAAVVIIKRRAGRAMLERLTAAEADVAMRLAAGQRIESIAAERNASRETVRSQLQAIFSKLGVSRQVDLVRLLDDGGA